MLAFQSTHLIIIPYVQVKVHIQPSLPYHTNTVLHLIFSLLLCQRQQVYYVLISQGTIMGTSTKTLNLVSKCFIGLPYPNPSHRFGENWVTWSNLLWYRCMPWNQYQVWSVTCLSEGSNISNNICVITLIFHGQSFRKLGLLNFKAHGGKVDLCFIWVILEEFILDSFKLI